MVIQRVTYLPVPIHHILRHRLPIRNRNDRQGNRWSFICWYFGSIGITVQETIEFRIVQELFQKITTLPQPLHHYIIFPCTISPGFDHPLIKQTMRVCGLWYCWVVYALFDCSKAI